MEFPTKHQIKMTELIDDFIADPSFETFDIVTKSMRERSIGLWCTFSENCIECPDNEGYTRVCFAMTIGPSVYKLEYWEKYQGTLLLNFVRVRELIEMEKERRQSNEVTSGRQTLRKHYDPDCARARQTD